MRKKDMEEVGSSYTKEEKDKLIKKEFLKLKKMFKELDKKTLDSVISLIQNAAFMKVTLEDLQEIINTDGAVSTYKNGENQWGTKKSPEVEIYNTMIKNYSAVMKQITELLPKEVEAPKEHSELDEFIFRDDD